MYKTIIALVFGAALLSTNALAQQQLAAPCTHTGRADVDQVRCENAIANQASSQTIANLTAASAQLALSVNDLQTQLAAAQAQIKKLQDESENLKHPVTK